MIESWPRPASPFSLRRASSEGERAWYPPSWVPRLFGVGALGLVPWIVVLIRVLPSSHRAANWDIAWAGFDMALALLLLSVAVAAWQIGRASCRERV